MNIAICRRYVKTWLHFREKSSELQLSEIKGKEIAIITGKPVAIDHGITAALSSAAILYHHDAYMIFSYHHYMAMYTSQNIGQS